MRIDACCLGYDGCAGTLQRRAEECIDVFRITTESMAKYLQQSEVESRKEKMALAGIKPRYCY
jgi:hypothetical protein